MSNIPEKKNLYLKGFECNLMEWKPQYLFEYMNWTVELISDSRRCVQGEFALSSHCFLYVQSGLKDFTFMCPLKWDPGQM